MASLVSMLLTEPTYNRTHIVPRSPGGRGF
jgi:hypothetical protein